MDPRTLMSSISRPRILLVCTGNICRSPMGAALLRARLDERGILAKVSSAGMGPEGRPADPLAQHHVAALGADLTTHRSRLLDADTIASTDLVLGMTRDHVREVVTRDPAVWPRCFTLKEFVRRASGAGPRPPEVTVGAWIERLHAGRERSEVLGRSPADDVADPLGQGSAVLARTAEEMAALIDRFVWLLWPSVGSEGRASADAAEPA